MAKLAFVVILAFLLAMAAPSLQQGGSYGGGRNRPSCYVRCNDAYLRNPNDYRIFDCDCNQYNFPPRGGVY